MSADVLDGGLEFVVDDHDLVGILAHLSDVNSHGHHGWVVVRGSDLSDGGLQHVWEWSEETN